MLIDSSIGGAVKSIVRHGTSLINNIFHSKVKEEYDVKEIDINDAPALKQANVSIAMEDGTDIAIEAGDIVLANSSLIGVVQAINLS